VSVRETPHQNEPPHEECQKKLHTENNMRSVRETPHQKQHEECKKNSTPKTEECKRNSTTKTAAQECN